MKSLGDTFAWVTAIQDWTKGIIAWFTAELPFFDAIESYGDGLSEGLKVLVSLIVYSILFPLAVLAAGAIFGGMIFLTLTITEEQNLRNRLLSENLESSSAAFDVTLPLLFDVNNALQAALSEHIEAIETTIYQIFSLAYVGSTVTLTSERSSSMGQALILTAAALPACAPSLLVVLLTAIIAAIIKP